MSGSKSFKTSGFVDSRNLKQISKNWEISSWSKAGISSTTVLRNINTKKVIMFDCGGVGEQNMTKADTVLITHTHLDHCSGLFSHARSRFRENLDAGSKGSKYIVPASSIEHINELKNIYEKMDGHAIKMDLIPASTGAIIPLDKNLFVECFKTEHSIESYGYLVFRQEKRIKDEYKHLTKEDKAALSKSGVKLMYEAKVIELAYTGDTTIDGFDLRMFEAEVCMTECTFINESESEMAKNYKHMLLSDLVKYINDNNVVLDEDHKLVLMHFSARYKSMDVYKTIKNTEELKDAICVLKCFGHCREICKAVCESGCERKCVGHCREICSTEDVI